MKPVLLSADGDVYVYEVPDNIAKKLHNRCLEFIAYSDTNRDIVQKNYDHDLKVVIWENPVTEFIEYIDKISYANYNKEKCIFVENLGDIDEDEIPEKYKKCNWFNF